MRKGIIVKLLRDRAFGFIQEDVTSEELFFHKKGIIDPNDWRLMDEGSHVAFVVGAFQGQTCAAEIRRLN